MMKKFVLTILSVLVPLLTMAQERPFPQDLCSRLDTLLLSPLLQRTQLGLMVYDLSADSCIYCYGHRQTLRPASTQKLLTAITAIDRLGGRYALRTSLYYTGTIADGTLTGNLYCVGGMDPMFSSDDLSALAANVKALGVDTIRGRIVADRSFKDSDLLGEGWCWDDDNPVLSPLLVDRKDNFAERLRQVLTAGGVVADVVFSEGTCPAGAILAAMVTHTLDQVLQKMMKESDNLYAEAVLYHLSAGTHQLPARAAHARTAIRKLIRDIGLNPSDYKIADGSGLSLYNYVTAELETLLLRYAWQNSGVFEYLRPALPIAGCDGTLKGRMAGTAAEGNVWAKTGTLTGISSLAGYCTAWNGHALAFCIINQGVLTASAARQFQDSVCNALCASPPIVPSDPLVSSDPMAP